MAKQQVNPPAKPEQKRPAAIDKFIDKFQEQVEQGVVGPDGRDHTKAWEQAKEIVKKQQ